MPLLMHPVLSELTLCVGNIAACTDSLVKRLRPDLHLGEMQVGTKPFFDWGCTLVDSSDAVLNAVVETMTTASVAAFPLS